MRGTPRLLAAAAAAAQLLQVVCATGGEKESLGSTAVYCYLLSRAIY